jgi:AAA family ATP:ADP antiporter
MIQALQVVRQVTQYAIARPSREMCFTVVDQKDRYKTKNVIDVVVYRFGDLSSAWILAGLRTAGARVFGSCMAGVAFSVLWGLVALQLGRRYEIRRAQESASSPAPAQAVRWSDRTSTNLCSGAAWRPPAALAIFVRRHFGAPAVASS